MDNFFSWPILVYELWTCDPTTDFDQKNFQQLTIESGAKYFSWEFLSYCFAFKFMPRKSERERESVREGEKDTVNDGDTCLAAHLFVNVDAVR